MSVKKGILTGTLLLLGAGAIGGGIWWWNQSHTGSNYDMMVYVSTVSELNAAHPDLTTMSYGGIVEAQKTDEIKVDISKTVAEIYVKEGDVVKKGTPLFQYDVEEMALDLERGQIEVEQMQNEISSYEEQKRQLEEEKAKADADQQISYTTQIQSLETSISKTNYEIKVKNVELQKQQKAIDNAKVTADKEGVIGAIKSMEQLQAEGSDVLMTITESGNYRIKGTISEQQMGTIQPQQRVIVRSRIDDRCWMGTITEFGTEAEKDNNNMFMMDNGGDAAGSKYPFYITLDDADGLLIGQHMLIEPDMGQTDGREGIWIYEDYLVEEDGNTYLWAADTDDTLMKLTVTLGERDDTYGIVEIKKGLTETMKIAYPDDKYQEGMKTTTNAQKAAESQNADGDVMDEGMIDEGMADEGIIVDDFMDEGMMNEEMLDGDMMADEPPVEQ